MATRSEDVLLQVPHVCFRKHEGTLYVMGERIAWIMEKKDTFSVSHRYADVKMQKISPEGKPKIQLQVVLHDGSSSTFHFVNPEGFSAQMKDRESIKELLQQLLPQFKLKINQEFEEKQRLLTENPSLLKLYKELVINQVLSASEFWEQHAAAYKNQNVKQDVGVSGAFLADIKPQTDGGNGLKYNLTAEVMESIFRTYPAVKNKHRECVPSKLTEVEFWSRFFQSHYFHRDRLNTSGKDIFSECARHDDKEMQKELQSGIADESVDITTFSDVTLGEGFGSSDHRSQLASTSSSSSDKQVPQNMLHLNVIRRFNQHSINILKAYTSSKKTVDAADAQPQNGQGKMPLLNNHTSTNVLNGSHNMLQEGVHKEKTKKRDKEKQQAKADPVPVVEQEDVEPTVQRSKKRLIEQLEYDDLRSFPPTSLPALNIVQPQRYLETAPSTSTDSRTSSLPSSSSSRPDNNSGLDNRAVKHAFHDWSGADRKMHQPSPSDAVGVLWQLRPGGSLLWSLKRDSACVDIPKPIQDELHNLHLAFSELLRHFWACFPPTTTALQTKLVQSFAALQRYQQSRLAPFEEKIQRELGSTQLAAHLKHLFATATKKYTTWQQRIAGVRS